jgi:hypothetical protein
MPVTESEVTMATQPKRGRRKKDEGGSNPATRTDREDQGRREAPATPTQRDRDTDEPGIQEDDRDDDR